MTLSDHLLRTFMVLLACERTREQRTHVKDWDG
ncbi:hypothetical protein ACVINW_003782 [Bradyrhizobium sp. USDA 4461]